MTNHQKISSGLITIQAILIFLTLGSHYVFGGSVFTTVPVSKSPVIASIVDIDAIRGVPSQTSQNIDNTAEKLKAQGGLQEIDGGIWFNTSIGLPPCDSSVRGGFWFSESKTGSADQWLGCMKDENDQYSWQLIR